MKIVLLTSILLVLSGCSTLTSFETSLVGTSNSAQANIAALAKITVTDLQAADADAQANGDVAAHQCYAALIPLAQNRAAVTAAPGAVSAFQSARDVTRLLEGNGSIATACAALNASVKSDVLNLGSLLGLAL